MEFWAIPPKIYGNIQFTKILSPKKLDGKADILCCERIEIIILERIWWIKLHFIIKKKSIKG